MLGDLMPLLANVAVTLGYAVMNIISKLAMESGMKPLVLVAYRQIFATLAIAPFAFFLERKTRPKITMPILFQIFLCSLTGATANQVLYFVGLQNSSATIACALNNVLPASTFVLAVLCRQEGVGIMKESGQAKVLGTLVCVGGAMLLSFYHGHTIAIGESRIHWTYADEMTSKSSSNNNMSGSNFFMGPFLVMTSAAAWSVWLIIQGQTSKNFPAPYTCTALMCFMSSIECTVIALFSDHNASDWSLSSSMRLIAALYSGIVCNAVAFSVLSWSVQKKGPLYVSVFSPLLLVIVAVVSWALLREKLYVGTVVGSVMIVGGLYAVLWGKNREIKEMMMKSKEIETGDQGKLGGEKLDDLELQLHPISIPQVIQGKEATNTKLVKGEAHPCSPCPCPCP